MASSLEIPTLDIGLLVSNSADTSVLRSSASELSTALASIGFVFLTGHGVEDQPGVDNPRSFAETVMKAMELGDEGRILLCVAWVTKEGKQMFSSYPQCIGTDITNGTNDEKRPLARATARDSNKKNIPFLNAFVASGSRWVHRWMFRQAFPAIFPQETLDKVRLVVTDDDKQCHLEFLDSVQAGIFPNAKHRLCKWHKINRNYVLKAWALQNVKNPHDSDFITDVEWWMYTFCDAIETEAEEKLSLQCLIHHIDWATGITPALRSFTREFVNGSFQDALPRMCHRHFMFTPQGDLGANSFSESENSALKRDPCGPRPQQSIANSQLAIVQHEVRRLEGLQRDAVQSMTKQMVPREEAIAKTEGDLEFLCEEAMHLDGIQAVESAFFHLEAEHALVCGQEEERLSSLICDRPLRDITNEEFYSHDYMYCQETPARFLVKRAAPPLLGSTQIPSFHRTRVVEIKSENGNLRATCSCGYVHRMGRPCRHIRCVMARSLGPQDFTIRHTKYYAAMHGIYEQFTRIADEMLAREQAGVLVTFPIELRHDTKMEQDEWFVTGEKGVQLNPCCALELSSGTTLGLLSSESNVACFDNEDDYDFVLHYPTEEGPMSPCAVTPVKAGNPKNAYNEMMGTYTSIANLCETSEDLETVRSTLGNLLAELMKRRTPKEKNKKIGQEGEMLSFPSIDKRRKDTRKKPLLSPSNYKKKRKTSPKTSPNDCIYTI